MLVFYWFVLFFQCFCYDVIFDMGCVVMFEYMGEFVEGCIGGYYVVDDQDVVVGQIGMVFKGIVNVFVLFFLWQVGLGWCILWLVDGIQD